jgi:hypothetical protein
MGARGILRCGVVAVLAFTGLTVAAGEANAVGTPTLNIGESTVWEGDDGRIAATVELTLSEPSAFDTTVTYQINTTATHGTDFRSTYYLGDPLEPKQVTIAAGSVRKPLRIVIYGDTAIEGNEAIEFQILSADAAIGDGTGSITILDDDPTAGTSLAIGDASVHEGDAKTRMLQFPVTLSHPAGGAVSITVTTSNGTATASTVDALNDYRSRSRTLTVNLGRRAKFLSVPVYPDVLAEGDETFTVTVSTTNPSVTITDATGIGTIIDND